MAMTVQPVDGLIHRLLQQNAKSPVGVEKSQGTTVPARDQVTISSGSKDTQSGSSGSSQVALPPRPGEKALESHLLNLYRSNDKYGG